MNVKSVIIYMYAKNSLRIKGDINLDEHNLTSKSIIPLDEY